MQHIWSLSSIAALVLLQAFGAGANGLSAEGTEALRPDCPVSAFSELGADPANSRYAPPRVRASCTDRQLVIESNGIPAYEFQQLTPSDLRAQNHSWSIPLEPRLGQGTTPVPLLGTVAVAVNGIPIYGPNEGPFPDPFGDPVYNAIVDWCAGHTAQRGDYHYHALIVDCLAAGTAPGSPDPVIAFSLDGFPVYGPEGCADAECSETVTYRSGWQRTGDPRTYAWEAHQYVGGSDPRTLDQCNGHTGPGGDYHYHATETFPYVLGCYAGADTSAVERSGPPEGGRGPRGRGGRPPRRGSDE